MPINKSIPLGWAPEGSKIRIGGLLTGLKWDGRVVGTGFLETPNGVHRVTMLEMYDERKGPERFVCVDSVQARVILL